MVVRSPLHRTAAGSLLAITSPMQHNNANPQGQPAQDTSDDSGIFGSALTDDGALDNDADGEFDGDDDSDGGVSQEARRLLDEVNRLGSRLRKNRMRAQQIDRRAAAYASRLARHTARLLQHMPNAVPAIRPVAGTGPSALRHYVLRHDKLEAPDRVRLLVVSADGRLRLCTLLDGGRGSRLWNDYEVANPPIGVGLGIVFEGLSALIVQLEGALQVAEQEASEREEAVDGLIAESEALLYNAGSRLSPINANVAPEKPVAPPTNGRLRSHGFERTPVPE